MRLPHETPAQEYTTPASGMVAIRADTGLTGTVFNYLTSATDWGFKMAVLGQYSQSNDAVGGPIQLLPQYSFCPVLVQRDQTPIFLFQFVEVLDGLIDYEAVKNQLPGLSFGQIGGAIAFIRKLSQFNLKAIDIDELLESQEATNQTLITNLRAAITR